MYDIVKMAANSSDDLLVQVKNIVNDNVRLLKTDDLSDETIQHVKARYVGQCLLLNLLHHKMW